MQISFPQLPGLMLLAIMLISAFSAQAANEEDIKDLRNQYRELKSTRKALEKYNSRTNTNNKRLSASIAKCRQKLNLKDGSKPSLPIVQSKPIQLPKPNLKMKSRQSRLKQKVAAENARINLLRVARASNDSSHHNLKLVSLDLTTAKGNYSLSQQQALDKLRKETLYNCRSQFNMKKLLNEQTDLKQIQKLLQNVKGDNLRYSKMMLEGNKKLIGRPFQFKEDVYKQMPKTQNAAGGTGSGAMAAIQGYMQQFVSLRSKNRTTDNLLDTTSMALNPYRGKRVKERLKPTGNFQFIQANNLRPAGIETAFVLKFLLTPRSTPFVGMAYTLGVGNGIQQIHFSNQGFGTRIGYEYQLFRIIGVFGSYEYKIWQPATESHRSLSPNRFIAGISAGGGKIYFGYNVLHLFGDKSEAPFVFRIGIK
jgi:hypothetical protein